RREQAPIVRPLHRYSALVRLLIRVHAHRSAFRLHEPDRRAHRSRMRPPSFQRKNVSTCMGSSTARGSSAASHLRGEDVAFPEPHSVGTSKFDPFRSSIPSPRPLLSTLRVLTRDQARASLGAKAVGYS